MMNFDNNKERIASSLDSTFVPGTTASLSSVLAIRPELRSASSGEIEIRLTLKVPVRKIAADLARDLNQALTDAGLAVSAIEFDTFIPSVACANTPSKVDGVKNVIAVASGKGGVGKSTTAANLALALVSEGASVGVLDADIYGPSQAHMLGVADRRPTGHGKEINPIVVHGLQMISMSNLVTEKTPLVWRGPMVSGALQQLITNTRWQNVDYLIVDMPPGTGDIALTVSQQIPVAGSVIVTTPQDIALLDAKKAIEMFRKVNVPVLGVVENMAVHVCSNCGHQDAVFGENGGAILADEYDMECLAKLPLSRTIMAHMDSGRPTLLDENDSEISTIYGDMARKVTVAVSRASSPLMSDIAITDVDA